MSSDPGRSRRAVRLAFATQGLVFISLTTRLPQAQERWDLGELGLSLVLLTMVLLAGVGSVLAEQGTRRTGSGAMLRVGFLMAAVGVPLLVLSPVFAGFIAGMAVYGVALGVVDATTNMQGVAIEHRHGRPLLPSFHGAWTLGGVIGAGLALAGGSLAWQWAAPLGLLPLAAATAPYLRSDRAESVLSPVAVPWRAILLVGCALVVFYLVDTAAATWGPVYLDTVFGAPAALVALATLPYLVASGLVRLAGDRLVARFGPVPILRVGALVSCAALAVIVFAPSWPVAVVGFTVLGAGVAVIAPLSFSAAAAIAGRDADPGARRARVDAVIARFNQFNYLGALVGAVLTGVVGAGNLRLGFAVPMVLVLVLLPLARAFRPAAAP